MARTTEDIWRAIQPVEPNELMWLLVVEQVDLYNWSVYATKPDAFAGRVEAQSIREAVTVLAEQIRKGDFRKSRNKT